MASSTIPVQLKLQRSINDSSILRSLAFFGHALAFRLVDAKGFVELFAMISPGLKLPTRHQLSDELLTAVLDECHEAVINIIKQHRVVSVVTDGWTDTNGSSIINFMVVAPGMKTLFWSSIPTGSVRHDAKYMKTELARVIDEIQEQTGARVASTVTDNASVMLAAGRALKAIKSMFTGGCAAHVLNLLIEDICKLPEVSAVVNDALAVTRHVRDHHALLDTFRVLQKASAHLLERLRALVIPVRTRWYSAHACVKSVLTNKSILKQLCRDDELLSRYNGMEAARTKLNGAKKLPIIRALRELESDSCKTSQVYSIFRGLLHNPAYGKDASDRSDLQAAVLAKIRKRWDFVHSDAMGIAFFLDPTTAIADFMGSDLERTCDQACDFAERTKMLDHLNVSREDFYAELTHFADVKKANAEWQTKLSKTSPKQWWSVFGVSRFPLLGELAELVFSVPTSSAASERAWSIMEFIHSKKRNRLSTRKVEMLTYVYVNLDMITNEVYDAARVQLYPEGDVEEVGDME